MLVRTELEKVGEFFCACEGFVVLVSIGYQVKMHSLKGWSYKSIRREVSPQVQKMTLEDVPETNMSRESLSEAMMNVLRTAQAENRLTCGLIPAVKLLETNPAGVLFCIMPESTQGNAALHIQSVLLQAFCYERDIHVIRVDCAEKLAYIIIENYVGPRLDISCVFVHQPRATDQSVLSESERQLVGFCRKTLYESPQQVIELPEV